MAQNTEKQAGNGNQGLAISAEGLKGRQSVRATFRLPGPVIELLGVVAAQLGLKQKSLFDQLMEDVEVLSQVAAKAQGYQPPSRERRQKTFVLSKRTVQVLEMVAREQQIPRDLLVEVSIRRLLPVMNAELEKQRRRAAVHHELEAYLDHGRRLLTRTERLLGAEDPACEMVEKVVALCAEKTAELERLLSRGHSLEQAGGEGEEG